MSNDVCNTCFVIAPIGDVGTEIRKRSDQVLKHIIQPAAKTCGYEAIRADQISEPGIITSQVIQHIIDDPMVVADLTGRNPNVFYELAVRHALRKPYVQIIQKGERIPFDVAGVRTIEIDHKDLDIVDVTKQEIISQMQSFQGKDSQVESPISISIDLELLKKSGTPEERQLLDVLSAISDLRFGVSSIEKKVSEPSGILPSSYLKDILIGEIRPVMGRLFEEYGLYNERTVDLMKYNSKKMGQIVFELEATLEKFDPTEPVYKDLVNDLKKSIFNLKRIYRDDYNTRNEILEKNIFENKRNSFFDFASIEDKIR
jgi:hypothetical protein